ncbi:MAG: pantoate--beta-alanine ligase [Thermodesulfobacteriota bacterium]|nr:pantoate--beta-alanine ligase [Thermodesulfobacteriota bacterium]
MKVIAKLIEMQEHSDLMRGLGKTIALVPTMGFLHEGHLSLIRKGRELGDNLIVSIFVNPAQFSPGEDFESYPRNFDRDFELAQKEGADVIFTPDEKELYSGNFQTYVELEKLPKHLCGISRPTFFKGVATVVTKLFNLVKPHVAVFGEKDYQQLIIIRRMVRDLNFEINIVGVPTLREPDGLAMSSRNSYLTPEQRINALCIYKSFKKARELLENGVNDAASIINTASGLIKFHGGTNIDYISICDPETLVDMETIDRPALMALAVKIGETRLIDNMILNPK